LFQFRRLLHKLRLRKEEKIKGRGKKMVGRKKQKQQREGRLHKSRNNQKLKKRKKRKL
jgi:hypothetical protein